MGMRAPRRYAVEEIVNIAHRSVADPHDEHASAHLGDPKVGRIEYRECNTVASPAIGVTKAVHQFSRVDLMFASKQTRHVLENEPVRAYLSDRLWHGTEKIALVLDAKTESAM